MKLANCKVGDCFFASSRAWGGGEYPLIVLDINRCGFNYECQHANGKIYNLSSRAEVRRATEEEFRKMELSFEHDTRAKRIAQILSISVVEAAEAIRTLGTAMGKAAAKGIDDYTAAVKAVADDLRKRGFFK